MQVGVFTPVVLQLLSAEHDVRVRAFRALESFLVRRMICRQTTKDYNRLTLELATRLRESELEKADKIVVGFLSGQTAASREWPSDAAIVDHLSNSPLYRLLTRGRLRLVLEGIESQLRSTKSEETDVPRNLTIEHLMPVSWKGNWPDPVSGDKQVAEYERNQRVHTIGNLTLLNAKLNSSVSNNPLAGQEGRVPEIRGPEPQRRTDGRGSLGRRFHPRTKRKTRKAGSAMLAGTGRQLTRTQLVEPTV